MQEELDWVTLIDRISQEPELRRKFLWLRAQEKEDIETVLDLEAVDPTLSRRMALMQAEFIARGNRLDLGEKGGLGTDEAVTEVRQEIAFPEELFGAALVQDDA